MCVCSGNFVWRKVENQTLAFSFNVLPRIKKLKKMKLQKKRRESTERGRKKQFNFRINLLILSPFFPARWFRDNNREFPIMWITCVCVCMCVRRIVSAKVLNFYFTAYYMWEMGYRKNVGAMRLDIKESYSLIFVVVTSSKWFLIHRFIFTLIIEKKKFNSLMSINQSLLCAKIERINEYSKYIFYKKFKSFKCNSYKNKNKSKEEWLWSSSCNGLSSIQ